MENVCDYCGRKLVIKNILNTWTNTTQPCHCCNYCCRATNGVTKEAFQLAKIWDKDLKDYELSKITNLINWLLTLKKIDAISYLKQRQKELKK